MEKQDLAITRVFDAPVEPVWKAWTDCEQVMRWWGPTGFVSPTCKMDLREGGMYVFHMRAPEEMGSQDYYTAGVYKRIVPMELLEFDQRLTDQDGNDINPAQVGMAPDFPKATRTVLTFRRISDKQTELTVTEYDWPVGQMRELSEAGMNQSLDKLEEVLAKH
jgi:uncharacterized protein YndB with AHSA1/START domain